MKKSVLSALLFCVCFYVFSQVNSNSVMQIMMPKNAFTGDRCELKYVFHSDADLFSDKITGKKTSLLELAVDWPVFESQSEKCFVYRAVLEHTGYEYALTLYFIPWHSGIIDFPPFNLSSLVRYSQSLEEGGAVFNVDLSPVEINSLVEKLGVSSLRPSKGPFTLPGTTFILILISFVFLAFAALVVFVSFKIPLLLVYFMSTKEQRRLKKITRQTCRLLKKLLRSKKDDEFFCQHLSAVLRDYLCIRFTDDFKILTTSRYYEKFEQIAVGQLTEVQNNAVMDIIEVLQRCDYIRFAKGSIDSRRQPSSLYETVLGEGERNLLVNRCFNALEVFSTDQKEGEERE